MDIQLELFDTQAIMRAELQPNYVPVACAHERVYLTSRCNFLHCLNCGAPIEHECDIMSVDFLRMEYDGCEINRSVILDLAEPLLPKPNKERITLRQWFVPRSVALAMATLADIYCPRYSSVLEPTCGAGMLLAVCASPTAHRLIGLDICPQPNWADLEQYGIEFYDTSTWGQMGSLEFNHTQARQEGILSRYDLVLMHPPFGRGGTGSDRNTGFTKKMIEWARAQPHLRKAFDADVYAVFVGHFLQFLKPGGIMIALTPIGWWTLTSFTEMRKTLLTGSRGFSMIAGVDLRGHKLWKDAIVNCAISVIRSGKPNDDVMFLDARDIALDDLTTALSMIKCVRDDFED